MSGQLLLAAMFQKVSGSTSTEDSELPLGNMQRFAKPQQRCATKDGKNVQCRWWFDTPILKPGEQPRTRCGMCQRAQKRSNASESGKASKRKWNQDHAEQKAAADIEYNHSEAGKERNERYDTSDKGKESTKRSNASESGKASKRKWNRDHAEQKADADAEYNDSKAGKAAAKRSKQSPAGKARTIRYKTGTAGKASQKRQNYKFENQLARSLFKMAKGTHKFPLTFKKLGLFEDNADVQAHFVSTFKPWMTLENQGKRLKGTEPNTKWQIGHKIPKAWFDHDDEEEVKKAWCRDNLFAQCAVENHDARDINALSKDEWLALKSIWPKQCTGMTDEEAWVWARDNVDNVTRKAKREAAKRARVASTSSDTDQTDLNATYASEPNDSEDDSEDDDGLSSSDSD